MNTHDIEAFVAVIDTGSISAAAAQLNLTQPAITRRIQNLEQALGTSLLDRAGKPLKPTGAGREAYQLGRRVLRSVGDLVAGVAPDGTPTGELRLGITPNVGDVALAGPIDEVRASFPRLSLRITSSWSPTLIRLILAGSLDAAAVMVMQETEIPAPLQATPLGKLELAVVAARQLGLPRRADLKAVSAHPWIVNQEGCGTRASIAALFAAAGLPFQVAVEAQGTELKLSLAARGIGLAIVPPWTIDRSAYRDELTVLRVAGLPEAIHGWIVHLPMLGKLALPVERFRAAFAENLEALVKARLAGGARRKTG